MFENGKRVDDLKVLVVGDTYHGIGCAAGVGGVSMTLLQALSRQAKPCAECGGK